MEKLVLIVLVAALPGLYLWYATIVMRRNRVAEALSGIDVQLNQRHDLIPNVLRIAQRFMAHERDLLAEITALRTQATQCRTAQSPEAVAQRFDVEDQLASGVGRLFALAENYPTLRADGPMIEAQRSYQEVETQIAAARRFYNSAVGDLRNATQIFPGPLLALLAGVVKPPPFFETTTAARAQINAAEYLGS